MWGVAARAVGTRTSGAFARRLVGVAVGAAIAVSFAVGTTGCADDPPDVPVAGSTPAGDSSAGASGAGASGDVEGATGVRSTVQALDNTFRPQDLVIEVGTEVVFENRGRNEHNVIPDPASIQGWGVGEDAFAPGDTYAHVFTEPGVYAYVCTIHGVKGKGMVGTITVEAAG